LVKTGAEAKTAQNKAKRETKKSPATPGFFFLASFSSI
jgi:hypothetical protein